MRAKMTPEEAVRYAAHSMQCEGFIVDQETQDLILQKLRGEITEKEWLDQISKKQVGEEITK